MHACLSIDPMFDAGFFLYVAESGAWSISDIESMETCAAEGFAHSEVVEAGTLAHEAVEWYVAVEGNVEIQDLQVNLRTSRLNHKCMGITNGGANEMYRPTSHTHHQVSCGARELPQRACKSRTETSSSAVSPGNPKLPGSLQPCDHPLEDDERFEPSATRLYLRAKLAQGKCIRVSSAHFHIGAKRPPGARSSKSHLARDLLCA